MMMAIILLFINTLSEVNCQQLPTNTPCPGSSDASLYQKSFRPQEFIHDKLNSFSRFGNSVNNPYIPANQEFIGPSSSKMFSNSLFTPRLNTPSSTFEQFASNLKRLADFKSQFPFTPTVKSNLVVNSLPIENAATFSKYPEMTEYTAQPNEYNNNSLLSMLASLLEQNFSTVEDTSPNVETSSVLPGTFSITHECLPSVLASQIFEPVPFLGFDDPQFIPRIPKIPQIIFSSFTQPTSNSPLPSSSFNALSLPSAEISSHKSLKSTIPSPLSLTESIPLPYLQNDPILDMFDVPIIASPIGCLDLTVTPYGTISETPLPDSSIQLPRSPFLPIASPVSALAPPLSPLLPPATPAARSSTFLRKVPVPPPFI